MLHRLILVLAAATMLPVGGCSDSTGPAAPTFTITGTVLDAAGAPVAGAAILLDLDFAVEVPTVADKPRTTIVFDLPEPRRYELRITDVCDDEVYYAVTDSAAEGGPMSVVWDGKDAEGRNLVEGLFHVHLLVDGEAPVVGELALARNLGQAPGDFGTIDCATVGETWRVAAWTDADGRFVVERSCWEFGQATTAYDEEGNAAGTLVVAPRIRAWAYAPHRASGDASSWTPVDAATGADLTVQLGPIVPWR